MPGDRMAPEHLIAVLPSTFFRFIIPNSSLNRHKDAQPATVAAKFINFNSAAVINRDLTRNRKPDTGPGGHIGPSAEKWLKSP